MFICSTVARKRQYCKCQTLINAKNLQEHFFATNLGNVLMIIPSVTVTFSGHVNRVYKQQKFIIAFKKQLKTVQETQKHDTDELD